MLKSNNVKTVSISSFDGIGGTYSGNAVVNGQIVNDISGYQTYDSKSLTIQEKNRLIVKDYNWGIDGFASGVYQFLYFFPQGAIVFEPGDEIAFNSISLWNAYYNITDETKGGYRNNVFEYFWPVGDFSVTGDTTNGSDTILNVSDLTNIVIGQRVSGTGIPNGSTVSTITSPSTITISQTATATNNGVTLSFHKPRIVVIPNGYYDPITLNTWFQAYMIGKQDYLIDSNSNYSFFMEWIWNPTYYRMQLICYAMPSTPNYTDPKTGLAWVPITPAYTPTVILNSTIHDYENSKTYVSNFYEVIGFLNGIYGTGTSTDQLYTAVTTSKFKQASNVSILCNLLYNPLKIPSDILYSFSLANSDPGSLLVEEPNSTLVFLPIKPGQYISIVFTLVDQEYRPIKFEDPNITITCTIRKRPKLLE